MANITNTVLTVYRANTAQAQQAVKTLRGVERDEAKKVLDGLNAQNAKLQDQIAMFGKVAVGLGAIAGAWKLAQVSAKAYLEDVRLESAASGVNIGKLREATLGLVEADNLLAFAGKAKAGAWKLSEQEMERVLRGAMALRKTMGVELQPTIESLTDAVARGSTKALKEFGIVAADKQGVLRQLDGVVKGLGGNVEMTGDRFQASGVQIADAFDDIQGELGKLVIALTPAIEALGKFVGLLARGAKGADRFTDWLVGVDTQGGTGDDQIRRQAQGLRTQAHAMRQSLSGPWRTAEIDALEKEAASLELQLKRRIEKMRSTFNMEARHPWEAGAGLMFDMSGDFGVNSAAPSGGGKRRVGVRPTGGGKIEFIDLSGIGAGLSEFGRGFAADFQAANAAGIRDTYNAGLDEAVGYARYRKRRGDEREAAKAAEAAAFNEDLGGIFNRPSEVNAYRDAIDALSASFDTLQSAAGSAYDVIISGQGNAMAAFKKVIAEGIAAMGKEFFVKGLGESAWAIADLARGNLAGASAHGIAAGKFFTGAAIAGVAAHQLGYGGSSSTAGGGGGGAGRAASVGGSSRSASSEPSHVHVYVGAEWAALPHVEQAGAIQRAMRLGKRGTTHIRRG